MQELNFDPFPLLETERLLLRKIEKGDLQALFMIRSDPEVMKHIGKPPAENPPDVLPLITQMHEGVVNNTGITWSIQLKENPLMIGTIGFWRIEKENYRAEIGYLLNKDYHKTGLATEAIKTVLNCGYTQLNLHSVVAHVDPANSASISILRKYKFKQEGYFRENYYFEGKFSDTVVFSLLAEDWKKSGYYNADLL